MSAKWVIGWAAGIMSVSVVMAATPDAKKPCEQSLAETQVMTRNLDTDRDEKEKRLARMEVTVYTAQQAWAKDVENHKKAVAELEARIKELEARSVEAK